MRTPLLSLLHMEFGQLPKVIRAANTQLREYLPAIMYSSAERAFPCDDPSIASIPWRYQVNKTSKQRFIDLVAKLVSSPSQCARGIYASCSSYLILIDFLPSFIMCSLILTVLNGLFYVSSAILPCNIIAYNLLLLVISYILFIFCFSRE